MEAHEFLLKHSQELSEKYPGKYVGIVKNKVVIVSDSGLEVAKKSRKKYPGKEVYIVYLPTDEETSTLLGNIKG